MSDSNDVQREVEAEARRFFPGAVHRVEWLGYGDSPLIEPGEILPQFVLAELRPGLVRRPGPRETLKAFQKANGPALKQFRRELAQRWAANSRSAGRSCGTLGSRLRTSAATSTAA